MAISAYQARMLAERFVEGHCRWCGAHDNFIGKVSRLCIDCASEQEIDAMTARAVRLGQVEWIGPVTLKADLLQFWRRRRAY